MAHYHGGILRRGFFDGVFDLQKGSTLAEEMLCYSLPYGGLGFTSHILTYYTVIILSIGRSPLRPWKKLCNSTIDMWLSTISLTGGFALAVFTLVKCRNHWQLLLIGVWKLSMTVFNGVVGVHIAIIMRKVPKPAKPAKKGRNRDELLSTYLPLVDQDEGYHGEKASQKIAKLAGSLHKSITEGNAEQPSTGHVWAWVLLYLPGMIVGFVGLASLIIQNWSGHSKLHTITYVFSGVMVFFGLVFSLLVSGFGGMWVAPFFWFAVFAGLAALYGDWALGAMVDNLLGMPSGDSSCLYWSYFILKRLTMFSS